MEKEISFPLLDNIKTLELEGFLPVSFLGKTLYDFGADAYLIKTPSDLYEKNSYTKLSNKLNKGKKNIFLDFSEKSGLEILDKILQKTDILIDSYNPSILDKLIIIKITVNNNHQLLQDKKSHFSVSLNNEYNLSSISNILKFFKNKENKFLSPQIILGDLFNGCLIPLNDLSEALINRNEFKRGSLIEWSVNSNLSSLSDISLKLIEKNKFHFSCITKNYEYILFSLDNNEKLNLHLKKICERFLIESLNLNDLAENMRLYLIRDYIDYFDLITKSQNDTVKYIKDLCKLFMKEEIMKNLKKVEYLEIYPILQVKELIQFFKNSNILKGDNIINSFIPDGNEGNNTNMNNNTTNFSKNIYDVNYLNNQLKGFNLTQKDIDYIKSKEVFLPKL